MNARDYVRVFRKRWRLLGFCLVVCLAAAGAFVYTATPKYQASAQLFVAAKDSGSDLTGLAQGGQFTQQRVQSYANIVNSPEVTAAVASQLNDGLSATQIAKEITASAPLNTVLVNVKVTDTRPARAKAIANAVSSEFATFVNTLETPNGSTTSPVKVTVVKFAELPKSPSSPKKTLDLILGGIVGLLLGLGLSILRETLDTTVKDPDLLQRQLSLSTLGAIAYDSDAKKRPLIVQADPHSSRAEAFRQLRTNLQFVDIDRTPRSIVVTSSVPNEGKTTTATNLAIALGQSGLRVLLVEADLRRPKIAEYLGIEDAVGLTSVLIGKAELVDAIQVWGKAGQLHVLPSGPTPPNPSELLGSHGMAKLVRELELTYDLVLIDAPPLLPVTDAAVLSTCVSGVLVVVRHGHTKREQLARAMQSLRSVDATVYGAVLSMTPEKGPDAYYYGYRYDRDRKEGRHRVDVSMPAPQPASVTSNDSGATNGDGGLNGLRATTVTPPAAQDDALTFFQR